METVEKESGHDSKNCDSCATGRAVLGGVLSLLGLCAVVCVVAGIYVVSRFIGQSIGWPTWGPIVVLTGVALGSYLIYACVHTVVHWFKSLE